jgi:putative redox protein
VSGPQPQAPKPEDVTLELEWLGGNRLRGRAGGAEIVMDSPPVAGPSPVQALAFALAGCMAMDVLVVIKRGRFELESMGVRLVAERAPGDPKRIVKADLRFTLAGRIPEDRVARAIELSHEKYCSVWHSMREEIELTTSFEVVPNLPPSGR